MEVKKYRTDDHPNFFFQFGSNGYRPDTVITKFKVTENDMIFSDAMMQLYSTPCTTPTCKSPARQCSPMVINLIHTGQFSQYPEINCKIVTLKKYQIFFICIENTFFKDTLIVTLIYTHGTGQPNRKLLVLC